MEGSFSLHWGIMVSSVRLLTGMFCLLSICGIPTILDNSQRRNYFCRVSALVSVDSLVGVANVVGPNGGRKSIMQNRVVSVVRCVLVL